MSDVSIQQAFVTLSQTNRFRQLTAMPLSISTQNRGLFSYFDAMIAGKAIETVPTKQLDQAWQVSRLEHLLGELY